MKARDYICDICGFGIREEDTYKLKQSKKQKFRILEFGSDEPYKYPREFAYDLCPDCAELMKDRMYAEVQLLKELQTSKREFFKNTSKE